MSQLNDSPIFGAGIPRVDGPAKLTGQATYTADNHLADMHYGYGVFSTIAKGEISSIDTHEALNMPGVVDIFHHNHFPTLYRSPSAIACFIVETCLSSR